jgi:hypothetical protein
LLYGEDSVKSASFSLVLTIGKATATSSGVYNFATATGRNELDEPGHAHWVMLIRGSTMYWPRPEFLQLMGFGSRSSAPAARPPVIDKPWVSRNFANSKGSPVGDLLTPAISAALMLPAPSALVRDLQRRLVSETLVGPRAVKGTPAKEYRLVLDGEGIINPQFAQPFGAARPLLVWVDRHGRLLQLSTSFKWVQAETVTLAFSSFNERVVVQFPEAREVESWSQILAEWRKALGHRSR